VAAGVMSAMTRTARRFYERLEPICLVTFCADECNEEMAALGGLAVTSGD
jgi:hypothetical protein